MDDMSILKQALSELNKEFGLDLVLQEGAVASRNYQGYGQPGNSVIPGTIGVISTGKSADYDITLTRDQDGKVTMQTEALMINFLIDKFGVDRKHSMNLGTDQVCNLTNARYGEQEAIGMQAGLGPILQRYSVIAMERTAAMQGHTCRREHDRKTGVMHVVSTVGH